MGSIYKITNIVNGKAYIGQTIRDAVKGRISDHLNGKPGASRLVRRAIAKYGQDAFTYEILHDGTIPEFLNTLEREAIAKFNTLAPNGYNLTTGGGSGSPSEETRRRMSKAHKGENHHFYGKTLSEEHRRKLSEAHKGKTISEGHRRKLSEALKGTNRSNEHCRKLSKAKAGENHHFYGKTLSEEHRRKIGEAHKGKTVSEETRRKLSESKEVNPPWNKDKQGIYEHSKETRQKLSKAKSGKNNPNYGRSHSEETRRKLSEALSGEKNPNYGKPPWNKDQTLSEAIRRKISEAQESPERISARTFFFSLPSDMDLKEKRKRLRQRFPDINRTTIHNWCQKFDSET